MEYCEKVLKYSEKAKREEEKKQTTLKIIKQHKFDTIASHGIYAAEEALQYNQGAVNPPIYLSSSQAFRDADELEAASADLIPKWGYTRIDNPTTYYLESVLALLEIYGSNLESSCCVTSSGMSAIFSIIEALLGEKKERGINFISSTQIYGGSFRQFSDRQQKKGVRIKWISEPENLDEWSSQIDSKTRFLYVEVPSNPNSTLCDIEALAKLAHSHEIPLVVDSTLATPALLRPLTLGADIVVHSLTKSITASGYGVGGAVISRKNLTSKWLANEEKEDFATHLKLMPNRDNGHCIFPLHAFLILSELRMLRMRMDYLSQNTQIVAEFLEKHSQTLTVNYLGLSSHPNHQLANKLLILVDSDQDNRYKKKINRYGHLLSFRVKGGNKAARKIYNNLKLIWRSIDLGKLQSIMTLPYISTHQQQHELGVAGADIHDDMLRLSVGIEHSDDIIKDLTQALK